METLRNTLSVSPLALFFAVFFARSESELESWLLELSLLLPLPEEEEELEEEGGGGGGGGGEEEEEEEEKEEEEEGKEEVDKGEQK